MSEWYKTGGWQGLVEPVEVDRANAKSVWIKGRRRTRLSSYTAYFPTAREAWEYLREKEQREVEFAKDKLQRHRSKLGQIEAAIRKLTP